MWILGGSIVLFSGRCFFCHARQSRPLRISAALPPGAIDRSTGLICDQSVDAEQAFTPHQGYPGATAPSSIPGSDDSKVARLLDQSFRAFPR